VGKLKKKTMGISNKLLVVLFYFISRFLNLKCQLIDSCLSLYGINVSTITNQNIILPNGCRCSTTDLVCFNSAIYIPSPTPSQLTFPNLAILFNQSNVDPNSIASKQRFSFYGYRNLVQNAFDQVKFYDSKMLPNLYDEKIYIDFLESNNFPKYTFDLFGNLQLISKNNWPKIYMTVRNEILADSLSLDGSSFINLKLETLSFKYFGTQSLLNALAFRGSQINVLEISDSNAFLGFTQIDPLQASETQVNHLIINKCSNFVFNINSIPSYENLESITLSSNGIKQINMDTWLPYKKLNKLSLIDNQINNIDLSTFKSLEDKLVTLDLSNNPLRSFEWSVIEKFSYLEKIDLSYSSIDTINSYDRFWYAPKSLKTMVLKGYKNTFDTKTICTIERSVVNKKIDLNTTFIELNSDYQCDCFLLYLYKDYRSNSANNFSSLIQTNRVPSCYSTLYSQGESAIKQLESDCYFASIINLCQQTTQAPTTTNYVTTPCFTTESTQPGLTTITIGNLTTITTKAFTSATEFTTIETTTTTSTTSTTTTTTTTSSSTILDTTSTSPATEITTQDTKTSKQSETSMKTDSKSDMSSSVPQTSVTPSKNDSNTATTIDGNGSGCKNSTTSQQVSPDSNHSISRVYIYVIIALAILAILLLLLIIALAIYFRGKMRRKTRV